MLVIYSDKIVLPDKIFSGYIKIQDNYIQSIDKSITKEEEKYLTDLSGTNIMAGIININSNNMNKSDLYDMNTLRFTNKLRVIEYSYAAGGVSTLYHGINLSEKNIKSEHKKGKTMEIMQFIKDYNNSPISLIDNKTHLKFQIHSVKTMDDVKLMLDENLLDFVSYDLLTNYKNNNLYKDLYMQSFLQDELNLTEEKADKVIERIRELRGESNIDELAYLIKYAHFRGVKVCTSEYKSADKIYKEFKDTTDIITLTSENCKENISKDIYFKLINTSKALEKCTDEYLSDGKVIISSDREPSELLICLNKMADKIGLKDAVKTATKNPADALGIEDRGEIKEGNIADIIAFKTFDEEPIVVNMIKSGKEVFKINI
ncbi:MAG: amidohydrolase family protein [Peptoanaerobacter stomatis]|uniref:amidohydrolase family protein n=1 Tax=Peptoanaerobacter stomatis TaxID=796937 RepID=UPI003FA06F80